MPVMNADVFSFSVHEKQDGEVISISRPNTNSPEMKYMREAFDSSHKGDRKKNSERDKPQKR